MRASLTKSTSLVLAATASAVLLFSAPFDAAMARGDGGASGAAAGAAAGTGSGGGGGGPPVVAGPAVVKASVIIPILRPPFRRRIVVVNQPRRGGCYVQAQQIEMELTDVEIDSFLNKCLASQ